MLPNNVYKDRNEICQQCEWWWNGRCRKGHALSSSTGCPVRKFPPIHGAGYDPDREPFSVEEKVSNCVNCGGYSDALKDITWAQVLKKFAIAMQTWIKRGLPLAPAPTHAKRQSQCQGCPHRVGYWCSKCKCLIYLKTKLATEHCPDDPPRWL